jgi:hypothetical protein
MIYYQKVYDQVSLVHCSDLAQHAMPYTQSTSTSLNTRSNSKFCIYENPSKWLLEKREAPCVTCHLLQTTKMTALVSSSMTHVGSVQLLSNVGHSERIALAIQECAEPLVLQDLT